MYEIPADVEGFVKDFFRKMIDNAKRLVADAVLLYERGSYASSEFLAMTAMEEIAKLQDIRKPFIVVRKKEDLDAALTHLETVLAEHREKQTTAFQAAPYMDLKDPKEWAHIVDMASRMVRMWGRDKLLENRLSSLVVDADVPQRKISEPAAVPQQDAYYFICAAYQMIAEYGDKGLDPFPLVGGDTSEGFDLWQWADKAEQDFQKKYAIH